VRILIAEDHGIVRQGLRALMENQADMEVVGEAQDGLVAVRLAKEPSLDVIITDRESKALQLILEGRKEHETDCFRTARRENKTIEANRRKIMEKLNAHSIRGVLKIALRKGLLFVVES